MWIILELTPHPLFLSPPPTHTHQNIPVAKFQLVCTACLLIAAKHEEVGPLLVGCSNGGGRWTPAWAHALHLWAGSLRARDARVTAAVWDVSMPPRMPLRAAPPRPPETQEVHPAVSELTGLSDGSFSEADLRCAELAVLQTLSYRVNCPTLYTFLLLLNRALGLNPRSSALACYLTVCWRGRCAV